MIDRRFEFVPFSDAGTELNTQVREKLSEVCKLLENQKPSRELALVLTKLEEAAMWLGKMIARTDGLHR
jgi:hypothetical protein